MTSPARNRFDNLPHYLLLDILSFLDPKTICSCSQVCKYFHKMVENQVWKPLVLRDYSPFLYTIPLTQQQLRLPAKGADIETIHEEKEEADRIITDPSKEPLTASQKALLKDNITGIENWKEFYIRCYKLPKLGGFWVGEYGAHGYELLRIYQKGFNLYAKKLTGDPNIPAGKLTWRMVLDENLTKGKGDVHLADTGFENSRWSTAYIKVVNKNLVEIVWFLQDTIGFWYSLAFGCARAGCGELRDDGEKINLLFLEQLID